MAYSLVLVFWFEFFFVLLKEFLDFGVDDDGAIGGGAIGVVIVLVVIFGGIKLGEGFNGGDDGVTIGLGLLKLVFAFEGLLTLCFGVVKNR